MKKRGLKRVISMALIASICAVGLLSTNIVSKADEVEETGISIKGRINKFVSVAQKELNYEEDENGATKYGQWFAERENDEEYITANWSCMFITWCAKEAGLSENEFGYFSYTGYLRDWFIGKNTYNEAGRYNPKKGDIVFMDTNADGKLDNAGIVAKNSWNKLTVIKGNVGKKVAEVKYDVTDTRIVGYGTPAYSMEEEVENIRLTTPKKGVDVSSYNGAIDWDRVKETDVEFAYVRVGYRGYGAAGNFAKDRYFDTNMSECNRVGIDAGVYFVTQAISEEEAIEEANWVYEKVKRYKVTYPIVIDTEQASPNERSKDLTKAERTNIIKAFCDRIEELGYKSQIYSGKYWFKDKLNMQDLEGYDIWVAEYTHNANGQTSFQHEYNIWQYTDKGVVDGINGVCDLNNCYVNYNPVKQDEGGNGFWDWFGLN